MAVRHALERLFDSVSGSQHRDRAVAGLLIAFVAVWTMYGVLAHGGQDLHYDFGELMGWWRKPALGAHHPPMSTWIAGLWFLVFPRADWAAYLLSMTVVGVFLWLCWKLFENWLDGDKRIVALAMLTLMPLITFHALKFNANTVMLPFWAAATLFFLRSYATRAWTDAALAGAAAGGAMLGKYWSIMLLAGLASAALVGPRRASYFKSAAPWVTTLVTALVVAPHGWELLAHGHQDSLSFITENVSKAMSIATAARTSANYVVGSVAYAAMPILALALMRPKRSAVADILHPATPDRRMLAVTLWIPLLLPAVIIFLYPMRLTPLWTIPNWSLLPVVLLGSPLVVVTRKTAVRILAVAIAVPAVVVTAAPVIAMALQYQGSKNQQSFYRSVASALDQQWRRYTDRPLQYVAGHFELSKGVAFYLPSAAAHFAPYDAYRTGGVVRLPPEGMALACPTRDGRCVAAIAGLGKAAAGRVSEVTLSRSYAGMHQTETFAIVIIPPQPIQ